MKSNEIKILVAVTTIGVILRIIALNQHDFWFDEAFTYHIARLPLSELLQAALSDNNPPLYYLLVHFVLKLSSNEIILRLPSFIASIASIILIYALLKKLINRQAGLIASALFSVSPLVIYIGTEARLHSLATLLSIGLVFSFYLLLKKPDFKAILTFFMVSTLALYTQYYILLLFIPFTIYVLTQKHALKIKKWIIIASVSLATLIPWLVLSLGIHNNCSCPNTLLSLPAALVTPLIGGVGEVTLRAFPSLPFPILTLFVITAVFILFFFIRGLVYNPFLTFAYLIPLAVLSFFGLFMPVFSPKAFAIFSPIYFAIVALGIISFRKSRLITIILTVLLGTISIIQTTNPFFAGTRLKPIDSIVKNNRSIPVAHTSLLTYYSLDYYSQGNQKHILITPNPLSLETLKFIGGQKQEVNKNMSQLWLVDSEKWAGKKDRENALKIIFDTYSVEKMYKVDKISVSLLKRK